MCVCVCAHVQGQGLGIIHRSEHKTRECLEGGTTRESPLTPWSLEDPSLGPTTSFNTRSSQRSTGQDWRSTEETGVSSALEGLGVADSVRGREARAPASQRATEEGHWRAVPLRPPPGCSATAMSLEPCCLGTLQRLHTRRGTAKGVGTEAQWCPVGPPHRCTAGDHPGPKGRDRRVGRPGSWWLWAGVGVCRPTAGHVGGRETEGHYG